MNRVVRVIVVGVVLGDDNVVVRAIGEKGSRAVRFHLTNGIACVENRRVVKTGVGRLPVNNKVPAFCAFTRLAFCIISFFGR